MALTPGTRLGSYDITAKIGAGGMGEVYRARDEKLGRDIAIAHVRWTMEGARTPPPIPEPRQGIQIQVLHRRGGAWRRCPTWLRAGTAGRSSIRPGGSRR